MKKALLLIAAVLLCAAGIGMIYPTFVGETAAEAAEDASVAGDKTTIRLWYSDDALTSYLTARAVEFNEAQTQLRAEPVLATDVEFLEAVNEQSLSGEMVPDLYIITNDALEKAQMSGLALDVPDDGYMNENRFPLSALSAVTYNGRYVAYPYYYETAAFMYNRTYLAAAVRDALELQKIEAHPEALSGDEVLLVSEEEVADALRTVIPRSVTDIIAFAEGYNAPDEVEAVFRWDVTDIFYNYFFAGNYLNVGGEAGDNIARVDLYNEDVIRCMKIYQELNQFFAVDTYEIDFDKVMEEFIEGKSVFTVATTDALTRIREAKEEGRCVFDFEVGRIPEITEDLYSRTMSVTDCIVVNGFSPHPEEANMFARYLVDSADEAMFDQTTKPAAKRGVSYNDSNLETFFEVYAGSIPLPKMIETSNLWVKLEIAFTQIWNGADVNRTLKELSETVMKQITGKDYVEQWLPDPERNDLTDTD